MKHPPRHNAQADLPRCLGDIHRVGFFRAIGSALDCLGAAVVGVAGLPVALLTTGLSQSRRWFRQNGPTGQSIGDQALRAFGLFLENEIADVGPEAWLDWTLDMRHMLVHRARRLQIGYTTPRATGICDAQGVPLLLTSAELHLPKSPALSDMEVLAAPAFDLVLSEPAATTIAGIWDSALSLAERVGRGLSAFWLLRRAQPNLIQQPDRQWPTPMAAPASTFRGYRPGPTPQMDSMISNPEAVRRLQVAALDGSNRHKWARFT